MTPDHLRRPLAPLVALLSSVTVASGGSAQRIFVSSEETACTIYYKPISGLTFHSGGAFDIGWHIPSPQYGPVTYDGEPNPAVSDDGTLVWSNPTANVTCFIDTYVLLPYYNMDAYFRWHINYYGGTVSACSSGGGDGSTGLPVNDPSYDSYDPYSYVSGDVCANGPGGTGDTGTGGDKCHSVYIYIDESSDGGKTWHEIWEGWATVCE